MLDSSKIIELSRRTCPSIWRLRTLQFRSTYPSKSGNMVITTNSADSSRESSDSTSSLHSCDKSSYISSVYSQYYEDSLAYTSAQCKQTLMQVSPLYVHVSFCLKVIRSWMHLPNWWSWSCDLHGCKCTPFNITMWIMNTQWSHVSTDDSSCESWVLSHL